MITLENVCKNFGAQSVLKNVNLTVKQGRTRVVLGLSGSGKSVLMKHMIGLLRADSGRIIVDGQDLATLDAPQLLRLRRKFGMVFQQAALFDSMTVAENVAFPLKEHGLPDEPHLSKSRIDARVGDTLEMVSLSDMAHKFPAELSGGMRKRVGLARAVILAPQCVLYDEPTTGLDPITTATVDSMILGAKKRFSVTSVVISHDVGSAIKVADDIAVIHEGRIVEDCAASEIRASKHPFVQSFLQTWFSKQ